MILIDEKGKVHISGNTIALCAEASTMLFALQKEFRKVYGKEEGDKIMKIIVSVVKPGSSLREQTKKSRRNKG